MFPTIVSKPTSIPTGSFLAQSLASQAVCNLSNATSEEASELFWLNKSSIEIKDG